MARKVNTQFILIVSLVMMGLMASGGGLYWYKKKHKDPKKLLVQAVKSEQEGAFVVAAQHYGSAGQIMHDPKLLTKAGDLYYARGYDDNENVEQARKYWNTAISTDPTYTPALERELACRMERKNMPGGAAPEV